MDAWIQSSDNEVTFSNDIEHLKNLVKYLEDMVASLVAKLINNNNMLRKVISKFNFGNTNTCNDGSGNSLDLLDTKNLGLKLPQIDLGSNTLIKQDSGSTKKFTCNFCRKEYILSIFATST